jgi:AbrB family looped-hinge helix DNA binding protein
MPVRRYMVQVDERGRFVLPAGVRGHLDVEGGGLLVVDLESDETVQLRKAVDVARSARGMLRDLAPEADLASELIADRRVEAEREAADELARR